jgi:polar amino acid transport system permease protein
MNIAHVLNEIWLARFDILAGLGLTIFVSLSAIVAGTVLGVVIGVALTYGAWPIRFIARAYVDILRGMPVLVLILASFYVPSVVHVNLNALEAGVVALTLFCGAHVGEVIRGALQSIPVGQIEAAKSIGLTFGKTFFYVLMPQAIRQAIPTWTNAAVEIAKATTLLSIIGVPELILNTQQIIGRTFLSLPFYLMVGILYFLIDYAIERAGRYIDMRVSAAQGIVS